MLAKLIDRLTIPTHTENHYLSLTGRKKPALQQKSPHPIEPIEHLRMVRKGREDVDGLTVVAQERLLECSREIRVGDGRRVDRNDTRGFRQGRRTHGCIRADPALESTAIRLRRGDFDISALLELFTNSLFAD